MNGYYKRLDAAYMRGWDSALIRPCGENNPYHREDFARWWANGRRQCLANQPLRDDRRYPWRNR